MANKPKKIPCPKCDSTLLLKWAKSDGIQCKTCYYWVPKDEMIEIIEEEIRKSSKAAAAEEEALSQVVCPRCGVKVEYNSHSKEGGIVCKNCYSWIPIKEKPKKKTIPPASPILRRGYIKEKEAREEEEKATASPEVELEEPVEQEKAPETRELSDVSVEEPVKKTEVVEEEEVYRKKEGPIITSKELKKLVQEKPLIIGQKIYEVGRERKSIPIVPSAPGEAAQKKYDTSDLEEKKRKRRESKMPSAPSKQIQRPWKRPVEKYEDEMEEKYWDKMGEGETEIEAAEVVEQEWEELSSLEEETQEEELAPEEIPGEVWEEEAVVKEETVEEEPVEEPAPEEEKEEWEKQAALEVGDEDWEEESWKEVKHPIPRKKDKQRQQLESIFYARTFDIKKLRKKDKKNGK